MEFWQTSHIGNVVRNRSLHSLLRTMGGAYRALVLSLARPSGTLATTHNSAYAKSAPTLPPNTPYLTSGRTIAYAPPI